MLRQTGSQHEQQEGPRPPVYVFLLQGPAVLCESLVRLLPDLLKLILLHSLKKPAHVLLARLQLHPLEMGGMEGGRDGGREGGREGRRKKEEGRRTMYQGGNLVNHNCQPPLQSLTQHTHTLSLLSPHKCFPSPSPTHTFSSHSHIFHRS